MRLRLRFNDFRGAVTLTGSGDRFNVPFSTVCRQNGQAMFDLDNVPDQHLRHTCALPQCVNVVTRRCEQMSHVCLPLGSFQLCVFWTKCITSDSDRQLLSSGTLSPVSNVAATSGQHGLTSSRSSVLILISHLSLIHI